MPNVTVNNKIIEGNPAIYNLLQKKYFPMIYDLVKKMGGGIHGDSAKDIYTDTILFLFEKVKTDLINISLEKDSEMFITDVKGRTAKLGTYLYEVARLKWLKSPDNIPENRAVSYTDEFAYQHDELKYDNDLSGREEVPDEFGRNFNRLGLTCQMIILLKKVCKVRHDEIAEFRGISHGSARNLFVSCWNNLIQGASPKRQGKRIELTISPMKVLDMIDIFLDNWRTQDKNWLWGEISDKVYYRLLPSHFEDKLEEITTQDSSVIGKITLFKEINCFLDEINQNALHLYKVDQEFKSYFERRNSFFKDKFESMDLTIRFMILLYYVAHQDKIKIAEFFEFMDDISALQGIHEGKTILAEMIKQNKILYNEVISRQ